MNILLADDDSDDRMFFALTLDDLDITSRLQTVENGEELMRYLRQTADLPDILFLDINMPLKNGHECLVEIKQDNRLKDIPVAIYSTSLYEEIADELYRLGAHFYIRKSDLPELKKVLQYLLTLPPEKLRTKPPREHFILSPLFAK